MTKLLNADERQMIFEALQRAAAETRASAAEDLDSEYPASMISRMRAQADAKATRAEKQQQLAVRVLKAESMTIVNAKRRSTK